MWVLNKIGNLIIKTMRKWSVYVIMLNFEEKYCFVNPSFHQKLKQKLLGSQSKFIAEIIEYFDYFTTHVIENFQLFKQQE